MSVIEGFHCSLVSRPSSSVEGGAGAKTMLPPAVDHFQFAMKKGKMQNLDPVMITSLDVMKSPRPSFHIAYRRRSVAVKEGGR